MSILAANLSMLEFETLLVDATGQPLQRQSKTVPYLAEALDEGVSLQLVAVPGGKFVMGAPRTEEGWQAMQGPLHEVTIAPVWMGCYPITQAQWRAIASLPKVERPLAPAPACFVGDNHPVEQISWLDAVECCDRLSALTGKRYRLPSEAEWEYGCRATTQTPFYFGETVTTDLANYSGVDWEFDGRICSKGSYGQGPGGSDRRETSEVGSFRIANAFGLYDMHGNVREWCQDCWHSTYDGAPSDGSAWITDGDCTQRVLRGGSWNGSPKACRSAARSRMEADAGLYDVGLRVVCQE